MRVECISKENMMQLEIMLFFQRMAHPALDAVANFLSFFGEEVPLIVIITVIYWCISKKKGFVILFNLMSALLTMQVLKAIFRVPRPFQQHPELIKGQRIETATGYSFPSGHSTGSAAFFSSLMREFRIPFVAAISIVLIVGVPLSRLYLGVHWPLDVAVGVIIGLSATAFLSRLFERLYDDKTLKEKVAKSLGAISIAIALCLILLLQAGLVDETAWSDLAKLATILGFGMLGISMESGMIGFSTLGSTKDRLLRFTFGIIVVAMLQALKIVFPEGIYYIGAFIRYGLTGIWITFLMPLCSIKLGIMERERDVQA